jgi:hypothetical protein
VSPVSSKRLAQSLHLSGECRISSRKLTPEEFLKGVWGETLEQERPESLDGFMAFITTFTDMNAKKRGALKEAAVVDEMYDLLATYEVTPTSHAETLALGFGGGRDVRPAGHLRGNTHLTRGDLSLRFRFPAAPAECSNATPQAARGWARSSTLQTSRSNLAALGLCFQGGSFPKPALTATICWVIHTFPLQVKPPTADSVKLDDLRETTAAYTAGLEAADDFIEEQKTYNMTNLDKNIAALNEEMVRLTPNPNQTRFYKSHHAKLVYRSRYNPRSILGFISLHRFKRSHTLRYYRWRCWAICTRVCSSSQTATRWR